MNALKAGLYACATVMPDESREARAVAVRTSLTDFGVKSFVGGQIVGHVVDALARRDRVERLRDRLLAERLEEQVEASSAKEALDHAHELIAVVTSMVNLAEHVSLPVPRDQAAALLDPVRSVTEAVAELDLDLAVSGALVAVVKELSADVVTDLVPIVFVDLATAGREVLRALNEKLPELARAVETEREHQQALLAVGDDKRVRELDRVKARIGREIDSYCRTLLTVRELENKSAAAGDDKTMPPIVIDFKAVDGPSARLSS